MPWWALIYFIGFIAFCVAGIWDDIKNRHYVLGAMGVAIVFILIFLQVLLWRPMLPSIPASCLVAMLIAAILGDLIGFIIDFRSSLNEASLAEATIGVLGAIALSTPAYVLAGLATTKAVSQ